MGDEKTNGSKIFSLSQVIEIIESLPTKKNPTLQDLVCLLQELDHIKLSSASIYSMLELTNSDDMLP